jgi:DNA polymerase-3 subunit beta
MRFRVGRDALGDAVAFVARALSPRPVIPMLSGIRIEADAAGLTLSCFDYEVSARARLGAEVAEPGAALVPGRLLAEITRNLPDGPAEFAGEADVVKLTCGTAEFELVSLAAEEYPVLPESPPPAGAADGGAVARAIAQVAPAASRDDAVPMLTAVCLDVSGQTLTLAATDRYRLAVREVPFEPATPGDRAMALVPARVLSDAARMLEPAVPVELAFGGPAEGLISLAAGDRRLTTRLISGEFVNYRSRFPDAFDCQADVPAGPLIAAVRRAALVAGRLDPVRLSFTDGQVVIEAHSEGRARAAESVSAEFSGTTPTMSFSPHYLLDGLVAAASGGTGETESGSAQPGRIRLQFTDPTKPALITWTADDGAGAAPGFRYLLVPMRTPVRG